MAEAEPGQQALLVLAYLRKGDTLAELAAGFEVGTTTAWRAEWIWGVLDELEKAGIVTLADKGYQGSTHAKIPYKGKNEPESQKDANRAHAELRGPGERANAQLKAWRILRKLRCCPHRAGKLAKAIHVAGPRGKGRMKKAQWYLLFEGVVAGNKLGYAIPSGKASSIADAFREPYSYERDHRGGFTMTPDIANGAMQRTALGTGTSP